MATVDEVLQKYGGQITPPPAATAPQAAPAVPVSDANAILQKYGGTLAPTAPPPAPERSTLEQAARVPVLAVQGLGKAPLSLAGLPADLANLYLSGMHAGLKALGLQIPEPAHIPGGSADIERFYTQTVPDTLGIPRPIEPESPGERILEGTLRAVGGVAGLAPTATATQLLTAGAIPGAVGTTTQEVTGSPVAGAVAQIGAAVAPTALLATAQGILRRTGAARQLQRTEALETAKSSREAAREAAETEAATMQRGQQAALHTARRESQAAATEQARITQARKTAVQRTFRTTIEEPHLAEQQALQAAQKGVAATTPEQLDDLTRSLLTQGKDVSREAVREAYRAIDASGVQGLPRAPLDAVVAQIPAPIKRGLRETLASVPPSELPVPRLRSGPPTIHDLELQRFLRAQGGIRLAGEELQGELRALIAPREAGTTGLLRPQGLSLQAMAERAAEAGYIPTADKTSLLRALEQSLRGQPAYSIQNPSVLDDLEQFFASKAPQAAGHAAPREAAATLSYQQVRDIQQTLGPAIRILERQAAQGLEVNAAARLGWLKRVYGATEELLDNAITPEMPAAVQQQLREANTLNRVQASLEQLQAHARYRAIRSVGGEDVFDADKMLMALKKDTYLRKSLDKFGALKGLEDTLADMAALQKKKLATLDRSPVRHLTQQITQEAAEATRLRQEALRTVEDELNAGMLATKDQLLDRLKTIDTAYETRLAQIEKQLPPADRGILRHIATPFGVMALTRMATGSNVAAGVAGGAAAIEEILSFYFLSPVGQARLKTLLGRDPTLSATSRAALVEGLQEAAPANAAPRVPTAERELPNP